MAPSLRVKSSQVTWLSSWNTLNLSMSYVTVFGEGPLVVSSHFSGVSSHYSSCGPVMVQMTIYKLCRFINSNSRHVHHKYPSWIQHFERTAPMKQGAALAPVLRPIFWPVAELQMVNLTERAPGEQDLGTKKKWLLLLLLQNPLKKFWYRVDGFLWAPKLKTWRNFGPGKSRSGSKKLRLDALSFFFCFSS